MARRLWPTVNRLWLLAACIAAIAIVVASTTMGLFSPGSSENSLANASANASQNAGKVSKKSATKPRWADLTPAQKEALAPLATEWDQIPVARKKKWLEIGSKLALMAPEEKLRVQERIRDWVKLTPEQRRVARTNYAKAQKLDPSEKFAQWQRYQQLTEDQKKELAALAVPSRNQVVNPPAASTKGTKIARSVKSTPRPELEKSVMPPAAQPVAPVVPTPAATPAAPEIDPA